MKNLQLTYPQAIVMAVAITAFAAVYLLAPAETRDDLEKAVLAVWGLVSTFVGPLLRKRVAEQTDAGA